MLLSQVGEMLPAAWKLVLAEMQALPQCFGVNHIALVELLAKNEIIYNS